MIQMFNEDHPPASYITEIGHIPSPCKFICLWIKHITLHTGLHRYESEALQWRTSIGWPRHKTRVWLWEWAQQTRLPFRELLSSDPSLCTLLQER